MKSEGGASAKANRSSRLGVSDVETPRSILEFWFGTKLDDASAADEQSALWWSKDAATDSRIRERFGDLVTAAAESALDGWSEHAPGLLALVLLTDQFPRNAFRDTPQAFATDSLALRWALRAISTRLDLELRPVERVFLYLPFEHAESPEQQQRSVALYRSLLDAVAPNQRRVFQQFLDFAIRHRDVVARFGRFPHRNDILGRDSTPEEVIFLTEPGSSF